MTPALEETHSDETVNLAVYVALLALTAATVAAGALGHAGRVVAISIAVILASMKACLIGFYYMGLRRESALTYGILGLGLLAALVLLVGIFPDLSFRRL